MSEFGSVLSVILGISLLIFVHELGHFLAARRIGVRVEIFSLGFGPRLWGFRRGATDYRLSLIPIGGYVMVAGQDPGDRRYPARESLWSKTVGQRALFFAGGVFMNLLFAFVTFPLVFRAGVALIAPVVGRVENGSPAWEVGLQPGDRIVAVAGKSMYSFENLQTEIALHGERPLTIRIARNGVEQDLSLVPRYDESLGISTIGIDRPFETGPAPISVTDGSAAAAAGLRNDDELLTVNGMPPWTDAALELFLQPTGRPLQVHMRRGANEFDATVVPSRIEDGAPVIGVRQLSRRVLATRQGWRPAGELALQRGDLLLEVQGRRFAGQPWTELVAAGETRLQLTVQRGENRVALAAGLQPGEREALAENIALGPENGDLTMLPTPDGAASAAGMRPGDRIVAIEGESLRDFADLRRRVQGTGDRMLRCEVERDGETIALAIVPRREQFQPGFGPRIETLTHLHQKDNFADALAAGAVCSVDFIKQIYVTLKRLFTGEVSTKNLGGPIRISHVSYHVARSGLSKFFYFLALLSLNLAILNVLPIPVLDGGYLMYLAIEKIKGSPVSGRMLGYSQMLGMAFVLALLLFVTYNDIMRLL